MPDVHSRYQSCKTRAVKRAEYFCSQLTDGIL
jgi:hypothetical protein